MAKSRNHYNGLTRQEQKLNEQPEILEEPVILEESIVPEQVEKPEEKQKEINEANVIESFNENKEEVTPITPVISVIPEKPVVKKQTGKIIMVLKGGKLMVATPDGLGYTVVGTGKIGDTIEF